MKMGYEISFTKYFYKYEPLRDLSDIENDIMQLEKETDGLLNEIVS
jgi:type I restriction enzyme M protein